MAKVLLVEDDTDQLEIYSKLLYYNGFTVLRAPTAAAALELARKKSPDVILMDVILPDMDGISTTTVLKASPDTHDIPVICMSAYDISMERVHLAGGATVLRKPIDGHDLVHAIRREIGWEEPGVRPQSTDFSDSPPPE